MAEIDPYGLSVLCSIYCIWLWFFPEEVEHMNQVRFFCLLSSLGKGRSIEWWLLMTVVHSLDMKIFQPPIRYFVLSTHYYTQGTEFSTVYFLWNILFCTETILAVSGEARKQEYSIHNRKSATALLCSSPHWSTQWRQGMLKICMRKLECEN